MYVVCCMYVLSAKEATSTAPRDLRRPQLQGSAREGAAARMRGGASARLSAPTEATHVYVYVEKVRSRLNVALSTTGRQCKEKEVGRPWLVGCLGAAYPPSFPCSTCTWYRYSWLCSFPF